MRIPVLDRFVDFIKLPTGMPEGQGELDGRPFHKNWISNDIGVVLCRSEHVLIKNLGISYRVKYEWNDDERCNHFFIEIEDEKQAMIAKLYLS